MSEENNAETTDAESACLTLEQILEAKDLPHKKIFIPQWNGYVVMRGLSRKDIRRAYAEALDERTGFTDQDESAKRMICWGAVQPRINYGAYAALVEKSAGAVQLMVDAVVELSGMAPDALQRARDAFRR